MYRIMSIVRPLPVQPPVAWPLWTLSGGWRMQANKSRFGLADLKRLRRQAEQQPAQQQPSRKNGTAQAQSSAATGKPPSACDAPVTAQDLAPFRQAVKTVQRTDSSGRQVLRPAPPASSPASPQLRFRAAI